MSKNKNLSTKIVYTSSFLMIATLICFLGSIFLLYHSNKETNLAFEEYRAFDNYTEAIRDIETASIKIMHKDNLAHATYNAKKALVESAESFKAIQKMSFENHHDFTSLQVIDTEIRTRFKIFLKATSENKSEQELREVELRFQDLQDTADQLELKDILIEHMLNQKIENVAKSRQIILYLVVAVTTMVAIFIVLSLRSLFLLRNESELRIEANMAAETECEKREEIAALIRNLVIAQGQLVQSAKMASLGEMAAGIAHELNNPLYIISGFNDRVNKELFKKSPEAHEHVKEYLQDISDGVTRMKSIIGNLKDFSRKSSEAKETVSIQWVIDKSLLLMKEQLHLGNITVEKCPPPETVYIQGDPLKLQQVFINLLANSKDAIQEKTKGTKGHIKIEVTKEENFVTVTLEDNGMGMTPETKAKVFDAFFTTKGVGKGTGLGGSISYGIIKDHGGTIACESALNIGTKFKITLPIANVVEGFDDN